MLAHLLLWLLLMSPTAWECDPPPSTCQPQGGHIGMWILAGPWSSTWHCNTNWHLLSSPQIVPSTGCPCRALTLHLDTWSQREGPWPLAPGKELLFGLGYSKLFIEGLWWGWTSVGLASAWLLLLPQPYRDKLGYQLPQLLFDLW